MKSLIFEGSGINGMAYIGVLRELENRGILEHISYFAGASSGAFISTMTALGINSHELEKILKDIRIDEIANTGYLRQIYNLVRYFGLHSREGMRKKLKSIFNQYGFDENLTFSQLYNNREKFLTIVVTDIKEKCPIYMNSFYSPNAKIIDVLVSSLAAPIIFTLDKNTNYVDGGVSDNYPIWIYSDLELLREEKYNELRKLPIPETTLGVKINEKNITRINNLFYYILTIVNTIAIQLENVVMPKNYQKQTISLCGQYNATFDFNMSDQVIDDLINYGMKSANIYLLMKIANDI